MEFRIFNALPQLELTIVGMGPRLRGDDVPVFAGMTVREMVASILKLPIVVFDNAKDESIDDRP